MVFQMESIGSAVLVSLCSDTGMAMINALKMPTGLRNPLGGKGMACLKFQYFDGCGNVFVYRVLLAPEYTDFPLEQRHR